MASKPKGLTLLELIIALAISAVVLQLTISMVIVFQKIWDEQFLKNKINHDFMLITERIVKQLPTINDSHKINRANIPYGSDLQITPVAGKPQLIEVILEKKIGQTKYLYHNYFKLGAY